MVRVTLVGPKVCGGPRQVKDRQVHYAERAWVWRLYLVGIWEDIRLGGYGGRERNRGMGEKRKKGERNRKLPLQKESRHTERAIRNV